MVQIPLLSGVQSGYDNEFIASVPLNLEPVALQSGISSGQLRHAIGAVSVMAGAGVDRGGIVWNGRHFRVMGSKLIEITAVGYTELGDVGDGGLCRLTYGFDRLAVLSGNRLFYYGDFGFAEVTDVDLGSVIDVVWVDGYFMLVDTSYVVVTELNDPLEIKTLKYGSAEKDPDPVTGVLHIQGEPHVFGRHTIQPFQNVGGVGFPFQTVQGATVYRGCVGPNAKCMFADSAAFVGSARDEALGVYIVGAGTSYKISDRTIDKALEAIQDTSAIVLEQRTSRDEFRLYLHLPDESYVYYLNGSKQAGAPLWCRLSSKGAYRLRNFTEFNGTVYCGDLNSSAMGRLDDNTPTHFGQEVDWQFDSLMLYTETGGFILNSVELAGNIGTGDAFLSLTRDGRIWGKERALKLNSKRAQWRPRTRCTGWLGMRIRGVGGIRGISRLDALVEPLNG